MHQRMLRRVDDQCQLWPSNSEPEIDRYRDCEGGEAISQVADEGMSTDDDASGGRPLEGVHRVQALFEMPVVALDASVEILRRPMLDAKQGFVKLLEKFDEDRRHKHNEVEKRPSL